MNISQDNSAQNSEQTQTLQNNAVPELSPDATPLEKKIVSHIKQCDKLIADYQQAQISSEMSTNTQTQTEQTTPNLNDLTLAFAKCCFDYGAIVEAGTLDRGIANRLNWLISDAEKLLIAASNLRSEMTGGLQ